jgi:hypothetical protein
MPVITKYLLVNTQKYVHNQKGLDMEQADVLYIKGVPRCIKKQPSK